ncbi:MAG: hypothetical protein AAFX87_10770 [Bacteroidota bacterium]
MKNISSSQSKLFRLDKNYILKEAQGAYQQEALAYLFQEAKSTYLFNYNPLGLEDDTVIAIKRYTEPRTIHFEEFYAMLCGIYRYKHGDNQLEFLFDGSDHFSTYSNEWQMTYKHWVAEFCQKENFLKAVLEATIFYKNEKSGLLAENRLKYIIHQHFDLKVYKYKGIVEMRVA